MKSNELKKVLILAEHFAPAYNAGGIVRSLENLVISLKDRFRFYIITSNNNLNKRDLLKDVIYDSWESFTAESKIFYVSRQMQRYKVIKHLIRYVRPDTIYISGIYSPCFTLMPLWFVMNSNLKIIVVLAPCGMLHKGALARKSLKKKVYLKLFKLAGFSVNLKWHATNEQELNDINRVFGKEACVTIADAIPSYKQQPIFSIPKANNLIRLITISVITPNKGHLRVLKALKDLQGEIQAEYHICGAIKDASFWQTCLREIEGMKSSIKVYYHGFIDPRKLQTALENCHVFILHSDFENFCQAIYEALAAGRPVITSDQTPWNNLRRANAGWNIKLNDFCALKDTIKELYAMEQSDYNAFCKGAKEAAMRFIKGTNFEEQYDSLFNLRARNQNNDYCNADGKLLR